MVSFSLGIGGVSAMPSATAADPPSGPVYELRVYTCEPGKLPALHERFRNHTMSLFERHGMKNIAYWVPLDGPLSETQLIYLLEHSSREAAAASWKAFLSDPEWKQVASESEKKHGKILARKPEATFLVKTDYSSNITLPDPGKVYQLRTYVAPEGKLDQLNTRFRDHTVGLFRKHGMESYGYWVPTDAPASSNTLIYLLEHPSKESAEAGFAAFRVDPNWVKAKSESEKNGSLTAKPPETLFLKLVDYSPRRATGN